MLTIPFMEVAIEEAAGALGLEPAAFRSFYEDALPRVYGYLLHRCGGVSAVAEDLTQETFLAAVAELRKGRRVEAPIPWIYGIARHKLLDHYRRQERIETTVSIDPEPGLSDVAIDESGTDARESAIAALASVPASQRAVLVLRYLDGYSMSEIAALLEKSEKAVESLLGRGRESFRRAYSEASA
jgi:RNA polymerase sigma-70 factor (ECF subfamily)